MVVWLNARFANGRPSESVADNGVIVHMLDGVLDRSDWTVGSQDWQGDHLSCSLINAQVSALFGLGVGLVVQPDVPNGLLVQL